MTIFLIDSWDEIKNEEQNNFLMQAVCLSGDFVPPENFLETTWLFFEETFSSCSILSNTLSGEVYSID